MEYVHMLIYTFKYIWNMSLSLNPSSVPPKCTHNRVVVFCVGI